MRPRRDFTEGCMVVIENFLKKEFYDNEAVILETRKAINFYLNSATAEYLDRGRTRVCFTDENDRVIKIPFTREGYQASSREVSTYENFQKDPTSGIPTAECFYTQIEGIEIPLLSMERLLEFPTFDYLLPEWVDAVDCGQVGFNSKGELVAYDL